MCTSNERLRCLAAPRGLPCSLTLAPFVDAATGDADAWRVTRSSRWSTMTLSWVVLDACCLNGARPPLATHGISCKHLLDCPRITFAMRRCAQVICALTVGRRRWSRASGVASLARWHRARASRPLHEVIGRVVTALRVLHFMRFVRGQPGHTFDKTQWEKCRSCTVLSGDRSIVCLRALI